MSGPWDAEIKLLYPVDAGTFFTVDGIRSTTAFDAIANVEIGENLNENVDQHDVWVAVRNLSKSTTIATGHGGGVLKPENNTPRREEIRIQIASGWTADVGDLLELVASYKVTAGVNTTFSSRTSEKFVVDG
ncbi:hypothetical protein ACIBI9_66985 [Nonomuraea sp. NPDC050451]|uniref:hypothetical protein n=1 Tax=Nonomuraea sp. NPDC050451 TaxID=3364364 RepID=UPI00379A4C21